MTCYMQTFLDQDSRPALPNAGFQLSQVSIPKSGQMAPKDHMALISYDPHILGLRQGQGHFRASASGRGLWGQEIREDISGPSTYVSSGRVQVPEASPTLDTWGVGGTVTVFFHLRLVTHPRNLLLHPLSPGAPSPFLGFRTPSPPLLSDS